jgi:hypothetical protein
MSSSLLSSLLKQIHEHAAERLSRILPQSCRLNYTYQGPRKDLRGTTFATGNKHAKIRNRAALVLGGSRTVPSVFRLRFSSQNPITKGL